jgi:hypothetical protein
MGVNDIIILYSTQLVPVQYDILFLMRRPSTNRNREKLKKTMRTERDGAYLYKSFESGVIGTVVSDDVSIINLKQHHNYRTTTSTLHGEWCRRTTCSRVSEVK